MTGSLRMHYISVSAKSGWLAAIRLPSLLLVELRWKRLPYRANSSTTLWWKPSSVSNVFV